MRWTIRNLLIADDALAMDQYGLLSHILAKIHNVNVSKKADLLSANDCNFYLLAKKEQEKQQQPKKRGRCEDIFRGWL